MDSIFKNLLFIILLTNVIVSDAYAQEPSVDSKGENSVGLRGFVIPTKKPAYYVNPRFIHRFNIISVEAGLFYGSDVILTDRNVYSGVSVGYIVKPFKKTKRFEPFFENRLLLLARYEKSRLPQWRGGGILEIGTGVDYRIKRFCVGVGFGMGVGYFSTKNGDFVDLLTLWMFPSLSVSYSFK